MADTLPGAFTASDLAAIGNTLDAIGVSVEKVSKTLTGAFASAIVSGRSLDATLQGVLKSLSGMALRSAIAPLQSGLSTLLQSAMSSIAGSAGIGGGGGQITPFAEGGVVARPTFFGSGSGLGLMGERGAEAIVPLARGPDGRLGLAARENAAAPRVTINITTPDVESFRRSSVQVSGALARAVAQGRRGM